MDTASLKSTVQKIVEMLVQQDYAGLEQLTHGNRLTATEMKSGVDEYRRTLVMPPDDAFESLDHKGRE